MAIAPTARTTRTSANAGQTTPLAAAPASNATSAIDAFIPTIPDVNADNLLAQMPHARLTKLDDEPTYEQFFIVCKELYRNVLAIKSTLGGGYIGHLGVTIDASAFTTLTSEVWTVPPKQGIFPTFPAGANDDNKKRIIAEFIQD